MDTGTFQQGLSLGPDLFFNVFVRCDNENVRIAGTVHKRRETVVALSAAEWKASNPPCTDVAARFATWKAEYPDCAESFDVIFENLKNTIAL